MFKAILTLMAFVLPAIVLAKDPVGFPFGKVSSSELAITTYDPDTSAAAFVMSEFGTAHFDNEDPNKLIFEYHTKIKILKQSASSKADIEIPLYKQEGKEEIITRIRASSYNAKGSAIEESKVENKSIFTEKNGKYYNTVKFAIPNVRAGSIIEYQYQLTTPFVMEFKPWRFQSDIPKVRSEYHTSILANYRYNITLRGYLQLKSHESEIARGCLVIGEGSGSMSGTGATIDCAVDKYLMVDVPAFKEEDFMTSKENFISGINFELSEVTAFDGKKYKYTKEWKDADLELRNASNFGLQLKRGKDVVDGYVDAAVLGEADPLAKSKKIYDFIKFHYLWNGFYGDRSELGIKKAFDEKKGNIGDINLTLIAALRYAGLQADPVLLATRSAGRPVELHPVLSSFNYVIAKLTIGDKSYLLDAVDDFMPFGSIPLSCYNGIGRVIAADGSYWMDIKPTDRDRTVTMINLKLSPEGMMTGTIQESSHGYAAITKRKEITEFNDQKSYLEKRKAKTHDMNITSFERSDENDLSKPLVEKFGVEFPVFDSPGTTSFLLNPFVVGRNENNPFKSDNRMYPVDFAVPQDELFTIMIELPENFEVISVPDKVGLVLPNAGGRYIFGSQVAGNKLTISSSLSIARPFYSAEEYPLLKEIFSRMVQAQNSDIIFQRKK